SLAILEVPSGPAVAGREARHRGDPGRSAGIERRYAGRLGRLAPGAVSLAGHERLSVPQAVLVEAAGDAVTRRARHRRDLGDRVEPLEPGVQRRQAGHFDRLRPGAVPLADDETLLAVPVVVVAAGRAAARRIAGHRQDFGEPQA